MRYTANNTRQYGLVLMPENLEGKKLPLIIEIRGVDPFYSPLHISETEVPEILELSGQDAIIAIPALRGNSININDKTYTSNGSPVDAWDGAADDAISLLNAITNLGIADTSHVAVFGKSRGGNVALLTGIRDDRFDAVVNWAGPSEWFTDNMGTFGFSMKEMVLWGLREQWEPGQGFGSSGQFIEQVFKDAIENNDVTLEEVRHRILARSPLYFLKDLPKSQHHYGREDGAVSMGNALSIQSTIDSLGLTNSQKVFIYPGGHDQPYPDAYIRSGEFLEKILLK